MNHYLRQIAVGVLLAYCACAHAIDSGVIGTTHCGARLGTENYDLRPEINDYEHLRATKVQSVQETMECNATYCRSPTEHGDIFLLDREGRVLELTHQYLDHPVKMVYDASGNPYAVTRIGYGQTIQFYRTNNLVTEKSIDHAPRVSNDRWEDLPSGGLIHHWASGNNGKIDSVFGADGRLASIDYERDAWDRHERIDCSFERVKDGLRIGTKDSVTGQPQKDDGFVVVDDRDRIVRAFFPSQDAAKAADGYGYGYVYKYENPDSKGNWTQRTVCKAVQSWNDLAECTKTTRTIRYW